MYYAAGNDHTEILKILLNFCPLDENTMYILIALESAAGRGHLRTVKFLLSICPLDKMSMYILIALESAAGRGHLRTVNFLLNNSLPGEFNTNHHFALQMASNEGSQIIKELISSSSLENLIPNYYEAIEIVHKNQRENVIHDLLSNRLTADVIKIALRSAAKLGRTARIKALNEPKTDNSSYRSQTLLFAVEYGYTEIVNIILRNKVPPNIIKKAFQLAFYLIEER